jgi:hypothetical protein
VQKRAVEVVSGILRSIIALNLNHQNNQESNPLGM